MQTNIADSIDIMNMKSECDASCKRLLSNKVILAWILKSTVEEFKDVDIQEIYTKCIEGEPVVSKVYVNPGETKFNTLEKQKDIVIGMNTENSIINEGKVSFDIIFYVVLPKSKKRIKMIVNVEAQNEYYPGYPIETRGVYYASRMISSQYGTEFTDSKYGDIKKVYSIWICMRPPKKDRNTITVFKMNKEDIVGSTDVDLKAYDLISVIVIRLGGKNYDNYRGILKLLDVLLSSTIKASEKKRILEEDFNIPISVKQGKELEEMCNISEGIWKEGIEKGIEKGMDTFALLAEKLIKDGRERDLLRAANDKVYRTALYKEYKIEI